MTMLAEVVDAVIGGDTHRDTHALEMLAPNGASVATLAIDNDDDGFVDAIAWIAEHAPGPRVVVGLEGTAVTALAWLVPCEMPGWLSSRSSTRSVVIAAAGSPTRSTLALLRNS